MKLPKHWIIFASILLIAIFFRLYKLSSVPPSPSLDEVSIGYNAYSILHTGHDEYGYKFPLLLRAYDDWRPALYVYLVIPFVQMFGLSVLAVRLPSVLLSVMTVIATFFLAGELAKSSKHKTAIALASMFLLAISPWHIYISRLGHEANAGPACIVLGILFFMLYMNNRKGKWFLYIAAVFLSLSLYTYQSEKAFTPLLVIGLISFFSKEFLKRKKEAFIASVIFILITIPIFYVSLSPVGLIRLRGTSAFTNLDNNYQQNAKQVLVDKQQNNKLGEILDNRRFVPLKVFLSNYTSHFNIHWLYANSGNEDFKIPNLGLFYFWEFPIFLFGLLFLIKSSIQKKITGFILFWLLISFIAPSIATQAPHAMRSFTIFPMPQVIEAFGIAGILFFLQKKNNRLVKTQYTLFFLLFIFFSLYSMFTLFVNYFSVFPKKDSRPYQYALQQSLQYIMKIKSSYNTIVISNTDNLYQSYMFYLFINQYDPSRYVSHGGTHSGGFAVTHTIDNVQFRPIQWVKEKKEPGILYIGNPTDFPNASPFLKFYYLDGTEGVSLVKSN